MLKKYKWILLLIMVPVLMFAAMQVPWGSSVEEVILSQLEFDAETVPRRPSGRIDFVRILDDASYLPPEENCVVDIARLFGMDTEPPPENIMLALGNPEILPPGERIAEMDVYFRQQNPNATDDEIDSIYEVFERPWTKEDLAEGEAWVKEYGALIDELHGASEKKGYYHPYRDSGAGLLVGVLLPSVHRMRSAARVLSARAMYYVGNGDTDAALKDLIANKDLAVKLNNAPLLVEQLVGVAMHSIGHFSMCELLGQELSKEQLELIQQEFSAEELQAISHETARSEKMFALDVIDMASKGGFSEEAIGLELDPRLQFLLSMRSAVDWEVAADLFIQFYDKIETASKVQGEPGRIEQMQTVLAEIEAARDEMEGSGIALRMLAGARSRGMVAGHLLMEFMIPALDTIGSSLTRQKIQCDLIGVATSIELFRLQNGTYPEDLQQLVPDFLEQIPLDRFNGGNVNFAITDTHYYIASAGPDGNDDLPALISLADPEREFEFDDSRSWVKVRLKKK